MSIVLLRAVTYDLQSWRDWVGYQPSPIFFKFRFMKHCYDKEEFDIDCS